MRIQYNQQHLLQKMVEFTRAFVDYKNTQSSNMQTICRFINRNQDHSNDVLDAISGLRTIHENEYRISLNAINKIKQEMRTMRFEYHNENENVDEANTSVESTTPLRETRSRRKVGPSRLGTRIGLERVTT
jgi:ribulose bisphosphate carboxylase small subunit